ncbi:hypothetical protein [Chitinophaga flava]|uniref:Uncharacterized protein n=1 Tax=Chitinophaga flava TaxID=2259036 RepID=A0A365XYM6_9BACT|nr:hypothetical protein [Chitinophaga flava]RBL91486.1 hypothetical protein DF182_02415 [Chitinophaga flava]
MMQSPLTWHFNIGDQKKAAWSTVLIALGILALILTGLILNVNLTLLMITMLVIFLGSIILTIKWMWRKETITLYHDRIESALYGVIYFSEIRKISSPWMASSTAIKLHLEKRKVSWAMLRSSRALIQNTLEEVSDFEKFLQELEQRLQLQEKKKPKTNDTHAAPVTQLHQINNTRRSHTGLIIGISAIFGLVFLIRACLPQFRHNSQIRSMKTASEQIFYERKKQIDQLVAQRLEKEGGAFLYTNDHAATIKLFPYIHTDNPLNIDLFEHLAAIKDMTAILANPDSAQLDIFIISGDSSIRRMRTDTTTRQFFLRTYDPSQHIQPSYLKPGDTTDINSYPVFDMSWNVVLRDTGNIVNAIRRSIPAVNVMFSQIRLRPAFYLYLTGKVKQGMNEVAFRDAVTALNQLLHQNKVDTSGFVFTRI